MEYEIVVTTADRPEMLAVSLPTFLRQTRMPSRLLVVDSSSDHERVLVAVKDATAGARCEVAVVRAPRGRTRQLNFGVRMVRRPIVFFPDDDALWYDDVAENVMRVYERDVAHQVGGVSQSESRTPPHALSRDEKSARRASVLDDLKNHMTRIRFRLLHSFLADPLEACGEHLLRRHTLPSWLSELHARPLRYQLGFCMTYRTDFVRRFPFNEDLHQPRCALEDADESFSVLSQALLVEATQARVYHHRVGGRRGDPVENGLTHTLNLCYVVCRHSPPGSKARRSIKPYLRYFTLEQQLVRSVLSAYEREKAEAMRIGFRSIDWLLEAPLEELTDRYKRAFESGLTKRLPTGADGLKGKSVV